MVNGRLASHILGANRFFGGLVSFALWLPFMTKYVTLFNEVTVWGKGETAWTFYIVGTITCLTA